MTFGLMLPVMLVIGVGALDISRYQQTAKKIDDISDFAALAGAKEMTLANAEKGKVEAAVKNIIDQRLTLLLGEDGWTRTVAVDMNKYEINVALSYHIDGFMGQSLFPNGGKVDTNSTAIAKTSAQLCMVTLEEKNSHSLSLIKKSTLTADDCTIHANSTSNEAIRVGKNAAIAASMLCSAGGITGGNGGHTGMLSATDCPPVPDPLSGRATPAIPSVCTETNLEFDRKYGSQTDVTLTPGLYCGGININKKAVVSLDPGVYIIDGGPLFIDMAAELMGTGVSFYFTGTGTGLKFEKDSIIDLSAPETGEMAGILFMQDPAAPDGQEYRISSDDASTLLGTIYLPNATLQVNSNKPVGDASKYTIVIAKNFSMYGQPQLYLNTDYAGSTVPVPEGVGPIGGQAILRD